MKLSVEEIVNLVKIFESKGTRIVIVRYPDGKKCLLEVPDGAILNNGDRVLCDTINGAVEAVCLCDPIVAGEKALEAFAELTGATFPLKKVIGKFEINSFDKKEGE